MGINSINDLPDWVAFSCFTAISLGTMSGGWKIVKTMGTKITACLLYTSSYNAESICMKDGKDIDSLIPYLNKNAINWIQIHGFQNTEVIRCV